MRSTERRSNRLTKGVLVVAALTLCAPLPAVMIDHALAGRHDVRAADPGVAAPTPTPGAPTVSWSEVSWSDGPGLG